MKCGNSIKAETGFIKFAKAKLPEAEHIYVIDDSLKDSPKTSRQCPKCSNNQASYWLSTISGEHAGIRQERTVEHYRCTNCNHTWTETK